jgi:hypothetical protein
LTFIEDHSADTDANMIDTSFYHGYTL